MVAIMTVIMRLEREEMVKKKGSWYKTFQSQTLGLGGNER